MSDGGLRGADLARLFHTEVVGPGWPGNCPGSAARHAGLVPAGLLAGITDPGVARLPAGIGSVEQWADSVDVLAGPARRPALQAAYRAWIGGA